MARRKIYAQLQIESRPKRKAARKGESSSESSESSSEPDKGRKRRATSSSSNEPPPKRSRAGSSTPNPPARRRSTSSPGEEAVTKEGWKYKKRATGARKRPASHAPGAKGEDVRHDHPNSEQYQKLLESFEGDPDDIPLPPGGLISEDEENQESGSGSSSSSSSNPTPKKSAKSKKSVAKGKSQGVPSLPQKVQRADKRWYGVSTSGEKCKKCEQGYRKERQLSNHICVKHGGPDPNAAKKEKKAATVEYVCPYKKCPNFKNKVGNGYTAVGHFRNHVQKHHGVTKEKAMQLEKKARQADNKRYHGGEEEEEEEGEEEQSASDGEEEPSRSDEEEESPSEEEESSDEDDDE